MEIPFLVKTDSSWAGSGASTARRTSSSLPLSRTCSGCSPPQSGAAKLEVNSYSLKHTAEWFLAPHCSYVSNGRLIWAAAALGIRIADTDGAGPNLLIGVSEREHDYVRRMVGPGQTKPHANHYCPAGYAQLQTALVRAAAGELITGRWIRPTIVHEAAPFHDWLILQTGRDDVVGDLASDYSAGVRDSEHRIARTPDELLAIFREVSHSPEAYDALVSAIAEWTRTLASPQPIRTGQIGGGSHDHGGWALAPERWSATSTTALAAPDALSKSMTMCRVSGSTMSGLTA